MFRAGSRNTLGADIIYVGKNHPGYDFFRGLYECYDWSTESKEEYDMNHKYFHGIYGKLYLTPKCVKPEG